MAVYIAGKEKLHEGTADVQDKELASLMGHIGKTLKSWPAGQNILTDDKAPVEVLGMQAMDGLASDVIRSYQEMLHKEGIEKMLQDF